MALGPPTTAVKAVLIARTRFRGQRQSEPTEAPAANRRTRAAALPRAVTWRGGKRRGRDISAALAHRTGPTLLGVARRPGPATRTSAGRGTGRWDLGLRETESGARGPGRARRAALLLAARRLPPRRSRRRPVAPGVSEADLIPRRLAAPDPPIPCHLRLVPRPRSSADPEPLAF